MNLGSLPRERGKAFERNVARILTRALGVQFERRLGQSRHGGSDVGLAAGVDSHHELWTIECKCVARRSVGSWWKQVRAATREGGVPVLVYQAGIRTPRKWVFSQADLPQQYADDAEIVLTPDEPLLVLDEKVALGYMKGVAPRPAW